MDEKYWNTCYASSGNLNYYSNYHNSGIDYMSANSGSYWSTTGYYMPQKPEFVLQMEEAIREGERQEQKAKEKLWQSWLDSKLKESLY